MKSRIFFSENCSKISFFKELASPDLKLVASALPLMPVNILIKNQSTNYKPIAGSLEEGRNRETKTFCLFGTTSMRVLEEKKKDGRKTV